MCSKSLRFKSRPRTFRTLTGLTVSKFNSLLEELIPLYEVSELERLSKRKRERNIGGGRKKALLLEDQLIMLLMYYI